MKKIPPQLLADLQADQTAMAFLWMIEMANGQVIRGTEHDQDITIPQDAGSGDSPEPDSPNKYAGTYYAVANVTAGDIASNTDLSVDNLDVSGAFPPIGSTVQNQAGDVDSPLKYTVLDVTVDEIESGLLDQAPVTVLICNWQAPEHGYFIAKCGTLGGITRTSDGKYTTEVRGLAQALTQNVIRTYTATCNVVKFGDARCKFPVADFVITGSVATSSLNLEQFAVTLDQGSPPSGFSYVGGTLTFTTGQNAGFFREVKIDPNKNDGVIQFWDQFPNPIGEGDEFTLSPGCDRQPLTCQLVYNNMLNIRAFGIFIPGVDSLTAGPTTTAELGA
jgi:uncharacterized phage protein (TIGR02218 family)